MDDVTKRATDGGYILPDGWTVTVDTMPDDDIRDPAKEFDCYSDADIKAWINDEWRFVFVRVAVTDDAGREWGSDGLGGVEEGGTDEWNSNPLDAVRDNDMIINALNDAVGQLITFGAPDKITEPTSDNPPVNL